MGDADPIALREALKKAAAALRGADVPFLLGGSLATWARGAPESHHDVDLMLRPEDAERALPVLEDAGFRTEKPPEGWLYKSFDGDAMVDLIFEPMGFPVDDAMFERAEQLNVDAVLMDVMALEDVFTFQLLAFGEHNMDVVGMLSLVRPLREQVDWDEVRTRTKESPYARAFVFLLEELDVIERGA